MLWPTTLYCFKWWLLEEAVKWWANTNSAFLNEFLLHEFLSFAKDKIPTSLYFVSYQLHVRVAGLKYLGVKVNWIQIEIYFYILDISSQEWYTYIYIYTHIYICNKSCVHEHHVLVLAELPELLLCPFWRFLFLEPEVLSSFADATCIHLAEN